MNNGLTTIASSLDFHETVALLTERIESKNLKIFATINHHENAKKNGYELDPTTLLIFGNPNVGAPLMQLNQIIGIDLPMKMLITQKDKGVNITYNQPGYLQERHSLPPESEDILDKVTKMLKGLTKI